MLRRHRRPIGCRALLAGIVALMLVSNTRLFAQSSPYSGSHEFRDATTVGFVSTGAPYAQGIYPYRAARVAPAGEFGGFLYRSPEHYLDFRGPEYVPIASADVGMPVADASGRVSLDNVPMWTDEWAARIIRNRTDAGIAVDSLSSARPGVAVTPSGFRPLLPSTDAPESQAQPNAATQPVKQPWIGPTPQPTQMQPVPSKPIARAPAAPKAIALNAAPASAPPTSGVSSTEKENPAVPATLHGETLVLNAPTASHSAPVRRVEEHVANSTTTSPTAIEDAANAGDAESPSTVTESAPTHSRADAVDLDLGHTRDDGHVSQMEPSIASQAKAVARANAHPVASAPQLTLEDLNRATAAGIAIGRGDKAFEQGEYDQARDEYRQAVQFSGDASGLRIALGLSDYALGAFDTAAQAIRQGVAHSPDLALSDFRLLDVYGRPNDCNAHRRVLDDHVTQNPEDANSLFLLGFIQYFSDQHAAARTTFGAYRSLVPHDELADPFIERVLHGRQPEGR